MESDSKEETEQEASHQFLKIELLLLLGQVRQEAYQDIEPVVNGLRDVSLKVPLAERSSRRLALKLPLLAVRNENAGAVKRSKNVAGECAAYVVLAVVLLNVLEVGGMINNMQAEERNGHLVGRSVLLVEGIPGLAAGSAVGLELLNTASEWFSLRTRYPFPVCRGRGPEAPVAISPADPWNDSQHPMALHFAPESCTRAHR